MSDMTKTYDIELSSFYEGPEFALPLVTGRIMAVECPEAKMQVGTARDFKLANRSGTLTVVLACTADIEVEAYDKIAELLQDGTQLYVGNHLVVGPLR